MEAVAYAMAAMSAALSTCNASGHARVTVTGRLVSAGSTCDAWTVELFLEAAEQRGSTSPLRTLGLSCASRASLEETRLCALRRRGCVHASRCTLYWR